MSRSFWLAVALPAAVVGSMSSAVNAQTICGKPVQPLCSTDILAVESEADRQRCLDDVTRYEEGLTEYLTCLGEATANAEQTKAAVGEFRACINAGRADCTFEGAK